MADSCDVYRTQTERLREQIERLEAQIDEWEALGLKTDVLRARLRGLRRQLAQTQQLLNDCLRVKNVKLLGVEVTQAIQVFPLWSGDSGGFGTSNNVPLVAGKVTIVRAYVLARHLAPPFPIQMNATARFSGPAGTTEGRLNGPLAATVTPERSALASSVNFLLPAAFCVGRVTCSITAFDTARPSDGESGTFFMDFNPVAALPLHGVLIHYVGPDFFDRPVDVESSLADLMRSTSLMLDAFPISDVRITGTTTILWTKKTAVKANFDDLFSEIKALRAMSGGSEIYCGVLPEAASCGGTCGLGQSGSALFLTNNTETPAHEVGHALGRAHVQCAVHAEGADGGYPAYRGFPPGSIGEFGLNTRTLTTVDPATSGDIMSYCQPRWLSPYTYTALYTKIREWYGPLAPVRERAGAAWQFETVPFLYVGFRVHRREPERVDILHAFSVASTPSSRVPEEASGVALELVGDRGALIASVAGSMARGHCGCASAAPALPYEDFSVAVPWFGETRAVQIVRGDRTLATLEVAAEPPTVELGALTRTDDSVRLEWQGAGSGAPPLRYGIRFTNDGGGTWRALEIDRTATSFVVALDSLPGGDDCRLQVVASAGFRTAVADSPPFAVPRKPRRAVLLAPAPNSEFEAGAPVTLHGTGYSADFGTNEPGEIVWTTTALGLLGAGPVLAVTALPPGRHRITVRVADGLGGEAESSVEIRVKERAVTGQDDGAVPVTAMGVRDVGGQP